MANMLINNTNPIKYLEIKISLSFILCVAKDLLTNIRVF